MKSGLQQGQHIKLLNESMEVMLIARPALNDRLRNSPRSIGETLFISAKTAGVHVSNILMKLGVTSRTEAAVVAHRLGLDT